MAKNGGPGRKDVSLSWCLPNLGFSVVPSLSSSRLPESRRITYGVSWNSRCRVGGNGDGAALAWHHLDGSCYCSAAEGWNRHVGLSVRVTVSVLCRSVSQETPTREIGSLRYEAGGLLVVGCLESASAIPSSHRRNVGLAASVWWIHCPNVTSAPLS
jgi:hypothetical protein